jgi:hypothetical protein
LKERDLRDDPEQDDLVRYWKISRIKQRAGKKLKRKVCGKKEETGDISSINLKHK